MRLTVKIILYSLLLISFTSMAYERPFETQADLYFEMLKNRDYVALERDWNKIKNGKQKIADGQPLLSAYYGGISGCVFLGCKSKSQSELGIRLERLREWKQKIPRSITAKIGYALFFVEYGWSVRGVGYASTVEQEQFEQFKTNIELGRRELEGIKSLPNVDAEWYFGMLQVAISQGWKMEQFDELYIEAVEKYKYYLPIYFVKSAYMASRWHGSTLSLSEYIEGVVTDTSSDIGDEMYVRLNWSSWSNDMFLNGQADWERMNKAFKLLYSKYPDPWNLNNYAKFSCLAKDFKTFRELDSKINNMPIESAWYGNLKYYLRCKQKSNIN